MPVQRALADTLDDLVHDETLEEVRREVDRIEEADDSAVKWCEDGILAEAPRPTFNAATYAVLGDDW